MKINFKLTLLFSVLLTMPLVAFAQLPFDESSFESFGIQCDHSRMPTGQGQHQWGSSYINWISRSSGVRLEQSIILLQVAPKSFHTNNFSLTGAHGGYIGLQTQSIGPDGTLHTNVRFSIWNTVAAQGNSCRTFGGEGVGYTCVINPFPLELGTPYTLGVERLNSEADGTWWQGSVTNEHTGETQTIGRIKAKHQGAERLIKSTSNFSEYFGPRAKNCNSVPQTIVSWTASQITSEAGKIVSDQFREFTKANPDKPCNEAGVQAFGERRADGDYTFYRMTNGSVPMCRAVPLGTY